MYYPLNSDILKQINYIPQYLNLHNTNKPVIEIVGVIDLDVI